MTNPHEGAEKAPAEKPTSRGTQPKQKSRLAQLSLAALGVVFGDISTSPIYPIRGCFHGEYGIDVSHANVLGILSERRGRARSYHPPKGASYSNSGRFTATAQTPGTELCHRVDVEDILPKVQISNL